MPSGPRSLSRRDLLRLGSVALGGGLAGCQSSESRQAGSLHVENRDDREHRVHVSLKNGPETTLPVKAGETVVQESFVAVYDTQYSVSDVSGPATVTLDGETSVTTRLEFHFHTEGQGPGGPLGGDYLTVVVTQEEELKVATADEYHVEHTNP